MISDKEPVSTTTDLYQIALLIDQLKHDDRSFRINAHRNLRKIAEALGPERTRKELVPFLAACCDDDDDVLSIMAESIGGLADQVGGADQVHVLLTPLEILLSSEEAHVRDMAIQSLRIVCDVMPDIDQSIAVL
jgi:serine/threonine-protein phosphatase 2A regulatory subunit A